MENRNKQYIIYGIILILLISTAIYFMMKYTSVDGEYAFVYDDSYQQRVANVIIFEYMGVDDAYPERFRVAYEKESATDELDCFSFMGGMGQSAILNSAECNNPEYWKYYYYSYGKSNIGVGYMIFDSVDLAEEYLASTADTLERFIMQLQMQGGRIESKVSVYPTEFGHTLDDYAIFSIVTNHDTDNPAYIMVSLLREEGTVYTIFERLTQEILERKLYISFTPELQESYLRRQPVMLE